MPPLRRRPRRTRLVVAAGVLAGLLGAAACTGGSDEPSDERPSSRGSTTTAPSAAPRPTTDPGPPAYVVPLALVVRPTRPPAPVSAAEARRVLRAPLRTWARLGQPGGGVDVVASRATAQALGLPASVTRLAGEAAVRRAVSGDEDVLGLQPATALDPRVRALVVGGEHPLRDAATYPVTVEAAAPLGEVVTTSVVGDVMLGRRVGDLIAAEGDPAGPLRPLAARLRGADLTIGNLESTLSTDGEAQQGGDSFGADPAVLDGLERAGFDLVSLANNHLGDYQDRAMLQTFARLERAGVAHVGAGPDLDAARAPVVRRFGGTTIGVLATESIGETPAATASSPGTNRLDMPPRTGPLDRAALRRITDDVRDLAARVDTVVVVPHWGEQYTHVPEPSQHRVASAFAEAGADLVVGGHPHWVQGWERIGRTTVVHSLGNFVFDMDFSTETQQGLFVEVVLVDGRVAAVEPVPYEIGADFAPREASGAVAREILDDAWGTSRGAYRLP